MLEGKEKVRVREIFVDTYGTSGRIFAAYKVKAMRARQLGAWSVTGSGIVSDLHHVADPLKARK